MKSIFTLVFALVLLTSSVVKAEEANFDAEKFVNELTSVEQWKALDVEQQKEAFEFLEFSENKSIVTFETKSIPMGEFEAFVGELQSDDGKSTLRASFTRWAQAQLKKNYSDAIGELDNQDPNTATLGDVEVSVTIYLLEEKILAAEFHFFQYGAYNENEEYGDHFNTKEEAVAAGWDPEADISWSNWFQVNQAGELLDNNSYWEWSGW